MKVVEGKKHQISLIHERIEVLFNESISTTRARAWRQAAGIQPHSRFCSDEQAQLFLAAAMFKRAHPKTKVTPLLARLYLGNNRFLIMAELVKSQAEVLADAEVDAEKIGPQFLDGVIEVVQLKTGQKPSGATIRRWCGELGIEFSLNLPLSGGDVVRLVEHCEEIKLGRKLRGKILRSRAAA